MGFWGFGVTGEYRQLGYIRQGTDNDWHYVVITNPSGDGINYVWNNKAEVTWSLRANRYDGRIRSFDVGTDCGYYNRGHTEA